MTVEDEKFIIEQYTKYDKSASQIIKAMNGKFKTNKTVYDILHKHNITGKSLTDYVNIDHFYFSDINTPAKAYILGFMVADGWVHPPQNQAGIGLTENDKYILEGIKKEWKTDNKLVRKQRKPIIDKKTNKIYYPKPMYQLLQNSPQLVIDLAKYGVVARKTPRTILPIVSKEFQSQVFLGILDGDGCFYLHSNGKDTCVRFTGSHYLTAQISLYLHLMLKVRYKIPMVSQPEPNVLTSVEWTIEDEVKTIATYLYSTKPPFFLERKYEKVKHFFD